MEMFYDSAGNVLLIILEEPRVKELFEILAFQEHVALRTNDDVLETLKG